jgi:hypothetical protein
LNFLHFILRAIWAFPEEQVCKIRVVRMLS